MTTAPGLLTAVLPRRRRCATTTTPRRCDTAAHAAFCRAMLERGDLPAALAVRGVVSVAGAHRRARGAHPRGRARCAGGGGGVSALARGGRGRGPGPGASMRPPDPGPDRFAGLVADPDRLFVLEAVYEGYLLHYGEPRAFAGMDARPAPPGRRRALRARAVAAGRGRRPGGGGRAVRPDLADRPGAGRGPPGGAERLWPAAPSGWAAGAHAPTADLAHRPWSAARPRP